MRENRQSGSEGGGAELNRPSLPLSSQPEIGKLFFERPSPFLSRRRLLDDSFANPACYLLPGALGSFLPLCSVRLHLFLGAVSP